MNAVAAAHAHVRGFLGGGEKRGAIPRWDKIRGATTGEIKAGDDAVATLLAGAVRNAASDVDDQIYSREAAEERRVDFAALIARTLPQEIAEGDRALLEIEAAGAVDWRQWEELVFTGQRVPGEREVLTYGARQFEAREVARELSRTNKGVVCSPDDDASTDALKNAGSVANIVVALPCTAVRRSAWRHTPATWQRGCRRDCYKGNAKNRLLLMSQRAIIVSSNMGELYEGMIARRIETVSFVESLQGVGRREVDVRHNLHIVADAVEYETAHGRGVVAGLLDVEQGFASPDND